MGKGSSRRARRIRRNARPVRLDEVVREELRAWYGSAVVFHPVWPVADVRDEVAARLRTRGGIATSRLGTKRHGKELRKLAGARVERVRRVTREVLAERAIERT